MNFNQLVDKVKAFRKFIPDLNGNINSSYQTLFSLKGAPKKVKGWFDCSCNHLTTLEDAPEYVEDIFDCSVNELTTLEGGPKYVGYNFDCSYNKLTSLKGAPEQVEGNFSCSNNSLTSLDGIPNVIKGDFICINNFELPILELARMDLHNKVRGDIYLTRREIPEDRSKCTREYYDAVKDTSTGEQQDITSI